MKRDWLIAVLEEWEQQRIVLDKLERRKVLRLLHAIAATAQGRAISRRTEDREMSIGKVQEEWALKTVRENIDNYARDGGFSSFTDLLIKDNCNGAKLGVAERLHEVLSNLREYRGHAGIMARDVLMSEVLYSHSLNTTMDLAWNTAPSPEKLNVLIGKEYCQYLCRLFENASTSIWIAVASLILPKRRDHPVSPLFTTLDATIRRGVHVTVFLSTDLKFVDGSTSVNGDRVFRWLSDRGVGTILLHPTVQYHANVVIVDARVTIIGSHRWSGVGLRGDNESSIAITDASVALAAGNVLMGVAREGISCAELGSN